MPQLNAWANAAVLEERCWREAHLWVLASLPGGLFYSHWASVPAWGQPLNTGPANAVTENLGSYQLGHSGFLSIGCLTVTLKHKPQPLTRLTSPPTLPIIIQRWGRLDWLQGRLCNEILFFNVNKGPVLVVFCFFRFYFLLHKRLNDDIINTKNYLRTNDLY